jgi:hypothetical protein
MMIKKKRIVNLESSLGFVKKGTKVAVGIKKPERYQDILGKIGFSLPLNVGDSVLPSASLGPISKNNAEGKYVKHKDRPMETAYRTVEWHWEEFDGPYDRVERSRLVDVPYKRYPRTFVPPYSVEITVLKTVEGEFVLISPSIEYSDDSKEPLKHTLNLFLEIFGECQLFTEDLNEIIKAPIRRLNWRVLLAGRMPWEQLRQEIEPIVQSAPEGNRPFILHRLKTINNFSPDFAAVGTAGFKGYVILGFASKNLYVCESIFYGNATYIFAEGWEELSKKNKAEILDNNLQKDRLIHRAESWDRRINEWLSST